jgi:chromate transporter
LPLRLRQIAIAFVRYANLTFGGGSATIAILHRELVARRRWIDQDRFNLLFALSRLTPGTNLLAFCAGVGWLLRRTGGAVLALLAASIPCAAIVLLVTALFDRWSHNPTAELAIKGAVAAAVGITAVTGWTIAKPYVKRNSWLRVVLIGGVAFVLAVAFSIPAVRVLLVAAIVGFLLPERPT